MISNDAFRSLISILHKNKIPHMVTGSVAGTYHGITRTTLDVDIVIDPNIGNMAQLTLDLCENGFYVSESNVNSALRSRTQFNVIHMETVWKIDLIIRKERPFSLSEFDRRQPALILETETYVATAEDLILAKLEWSKMSSSKRQQEDVSVILEVKSEVLDYIYIDQWAKKLEVYDLWSLIRD